jgi:hypothetical protein
MHASAGRERRPARYEKISEQNGRRRAFSSSNGYAPEGAEAGSKFSSAGYHGFLSWLCNSGKTVRVTQARNHPRAPLVFPRSHSSPRAAISCRHSKVSVTNLPVIREAIQKHELPRRSIAVRFAPNKQTRQDGFDATLSAMTGPPHCKMAAGEPVTSRPLPSVPTCGIIFSATLANSARRANS